MELLTAAVAHFGVLDKLAAGPLTAGELRSATGLGERQFSVLLTGLKALKLLEERNGRLQPTALAREHLAPGRPLDVSDYIRMAADSPGVAALVMHMRTSKLAGAARDDDRAVFIFKDGLDSAMEEDTLARHFTLMLAGRAKILLRYWLKVDLRASFLLDIGGEPGCTAFLQRYPRLRRLFSTARCAKGRRRVRASVQRRRAPRILAGDMFTGIPTDCGVHLL
jgi:hypothetical protein